MSEGEGKNSVFTDMPDKCSSVSMKHKQFIIETEDAISRGIIQLPPDVQYEFQPVKVFRKVKLNTIKTTLDETDFYCQIQLNSHNIPLPRPVNESDFMEYGCSFFFTDLQSLFDIFSKSTIKRKEKYL